MVGLVQGKLKFINWLCTKPIYKLSICAKEFFLLNFYWMEYPLVIENFCKKFQAVNKLQIENAIKFVIYFLRKQKAKYYCVLYTKKYFLLFF